MSPVSAKYRGDTTGVELLEAPDVSELRCKAIVKRTRRWWWFDKVEEFRELLEDISIVYRHLGRVYKVTAFKGFVWDGASIPRFAWGMPTIGHPFSHTNLIASLFHDLGYSTHWESRDVIDDLFGCLVDHAGGVSWAKETAVEVFGGMPWEKSQKEIAKARRQFCVIEIPIQGNSSFEPVLRRGGKIPSTERRL